MESIKHFEIIDIESSESDELIKTTIDVEPTKSNLIPNNIELTNLFIINGSEDIIKTIKANSIVLEQESKQETLVSSIELEVVNNNKTQCCFFFQYPKWRK